MYQDNKLSRKGHVWSRRLGAVYGNRNWARLKASLILLLSYSISGSVTAQDESGESVRGFLSASRTVSLASAMEGRVDRIYVKPGQRVSKGEPLVHYDCTERSAELDSARYRLEQRNLQHQTKSELYEFQAISLAEYELSAVRTDEAASEVRLLEARVKNCRLTAPFSGTVSEVTAKEHAYVLVGEPVLTIFNDRELDVVMNVPSNWVRENLVGKIMNVRILETGDSYSAKVHEVWPNIDANSRTIKIGARITNPTNKLIPGMTVESVPQ